MKNVEQALAERIKELRRRQFGPRSKVEFARRVGVSPEEYERYERNAVPPGEILVRMCEVTGEDLQWLLTGVAARGTVVISQTRSRHQELLTRLAKLLDEKPALAAAVEAFVDLLLRGTGARAGAVQQLPSPAPRDLIPIYEGHELPVRLPEDGGKALGAEFPLAPSLSAASVTQRRVARLAEPASEYDPAAFCPVEVLTMKAEDGLARSGVCGPEIAGCFPAMFGVRLPDDAMKPMFVAGDAVLVSAGTGPKIGRPALCRFDSEAAVIRCRIWLGEDETSVHLGRLADGEIEHVSRARVCWSLEVLYRLAAA